MTLFFHDFNMNMTSQSRNSLTFRRIIEAFKFGFAWRSRLGDPAFNISMNEVRNMLTTNLVVLCNETNMRKFAIMRSNCRLELAKIHK